MDRPLPRSDLRRDPLRERLLIRFAARLLYDVAQKDVARVAVFVLGVRFKIGLALGDTGDHLVLCSPIGLEDYRFYVPPVTDEELAKRERGLTADGYRKQLMTNYALSLPSSAIEPFVQLREEIKESGEYPRWLKSFGLPTR